MSKNTPSYISIKQKEIWHSTLLGAASRIFSLIVGLGAFTIGFFQFDFELSDPVVVGLFSVLLVLFIDRAASMVSDYRRQSENLSQLLTIQASIEKSFSLEELSSEQKAISYLKEKAPLARVVVNSFIGTEEGWYGTQPVNSEIVDLYKSFFSGNGEEWIDLISHNELSGPRMQGLGNLSDGARYKAILLKHSMPVLNFTILDYGNSDREVLFGWTYKTSPLSGEIFRSTSPSLINLFQDYYYALADEKIEELPLLPVKQRKAHSSLLLGRNYVDRAGFWITIGYEDDQLKSIGILQIDFNASGLSISGAILWKNMYEDRTPSHGIEEVVHEEGMVSYSRKKIFLEYGNPSTRRRGFCVYNFRRVGLDDRLIGYLQDDGQATRIQILGLKTNAIANPDWRQCEKYIVDRRDEIMKLVDTVQCEFEWTDFGLDTQPTKGTRE